MLEAVRLQVFSSLLDFITRSGASSPAAPATSNADPDRQPLLQEQSAISHVPDELSSETFVLSDGREIGIAYFGAQSGPAVFYLHGFPGCRLSGVFFDGPGKKLGARIIAVERPGIGISSPRPGYRALDHANDLREVAEHLNLESYGIIGISGGGPYALACAHALPEENLKSVSVVAGIGPIDIGTKGMSWNNWLIFKAFMYFPALVRWFQKRVVSILYSLPPEKMAELVSGRLSRRSYSWLGPSEKDMARLRDPEFLTMLIGFYREHYRQGVDGHMEDGRVLTSDLGFRVEDIRSSLPIQLWYSRQDTNVPLRIGEAIATRLSSPPDLHVVEDETHLSLVLGYSHDALERLLEKM